MTDKPTPDFEPFALRDSRQICVILCPHSYITGYELHGEWTWHVHNYPAAGGLAPKAAWLRAGWNPMPLEDLPCRLS